MNTDSIVLRGAREHNLKNINLRFPRNKLIVVTGMSGSGKSSLVFDTLYAEGQRRYIESLSAYARQFLEQYKKPDFDHIEGLSPAIAIDQRTAGGSPRSVVGTQTEIYDYLRLLFARAGEVHCARCGERITQYSLDELLAYVFENFSGKKLRILSPVICGKKGTHLQIFEMLRREGFLRVLVNGQEYALDSLPKLERYKNHTIEIIVDRIQVESKDRSRIASSLELAAHYSKGVIVFAVEGTAKKTVLNTKFFCVHCGMGIPELEPRMFSFNSPYGACPLCKGLGIKLEFDPERVVPNPSLSLREGALAPWRKGSRGYIMYYRSILASVANRLGIDRDIPFFRLSQKIRHTLLYGSESLEVWGRKFEGVIPHLERLLRTTTSEYVKGEISHFMSTKPCSLCEGKRLRKESLAVFVGGKSIWDIMELSIADASRFFEQLHFFPYQEKIAAPIIKEIQAKLTFCLSLGLEYLALNRLSSTLSGGEAQRIKLATQLGSYLCGVLYILDEPTVGLHARDTKKLIDILLMLRDLGNTVLVVEHDAQVIRSADWIVDLGPGAGEMGGEIIFSDQADRFTQSHSLTAQYMVGTKRIEKPARRRSYKERKQLVIERADANNLKNIDVKIPLGVFCCVTGVSGSGKSTLVDDVLCKNIRAARTHKRFHGCLRLLNSEFIDDLVMVDQSPIGRTPRSNPATYTGLFSLIRSLFSELPLAKSKGFQPSRFSFNVRGGRCEACSGEGIRQIAMHFLPDVHVQCEVCSGKRFNSETLEVKFKGYSISDILDLSVGKACKLFENIPRIMKILQTLSDVGLGYIALGQAATTLSGGEAQRVKLSKYLRERASTQTLYVLDEPTTGLHFEDVSKLLNILNRLVEKGNTVLVIEHNLDVIAYADYIIDLGPEGGDRGGFLVGTGSPEELMEVNASYTGKFLRTKGGL